MKIKIVIEAIMHDSSFKFCPSRRDVCGGCELDAIRLRQAVDVFLESKDIEGVNIIIQEGWK